MLWCSTHTQYTPSAPQTPLLSIGLNPLVLMRCCCSSYENIPSQWPQLSFKWSVNRAKKNPERTHCAKLHPNELKNKHYQVVAEEKKVFFFGGEKWVLIRHGTLNWLRFISFSIKSAFGVWPRLYYCATFCVVFRPVLAFGNLLFVHASTNATDDHKYSPLPSADFDSSGVLVSFSAFIVS